MSAPENRQVAAKAAKKGLKATQNKARLQEKRHPSRHLKNIDLVARTNSSYAGRP